MRITSNIEGFKELNTSEIIKEQRPLFLASLY